ncbi:PTS transporter subunit EIIC [Neobacillus sp. MER 74]|uniref:PTS transporter subunit EIIC n=1 Tax=Neobacillus sp. MER 74 TaxID=2939566 RepID=UPI00203AD94C|nr:PTS transporter subunit EIIC [Neobacillus sp. MER 74]MCM3118494.1 PTS transporter subunit EIIC [Neobacillus sp. MER 74]
MQDLKQSVEQIIESVGGADNVQSGTHCVTRLRLILNDQSLVDGKKLEEIDIVKGSFEASGQFQVIIGPGLVEKVYGEFISQTGISENSKEEIKEMVNQKNNPIQKAVRTLADIFIPILPAIVAAGLLMGLNNVLANPGIFFKDKSFLDVYSSWDGAAGIINVIANTAFTFLPALIGWSAVKKFGGNPVLGIVLGLVLVHPSLMSAYEFAADPSKAENWSLFGIHIPKVGYQGQVIPVIFAAYILSFCELKLKKIIPESIQLILVSPIALLVTGFITFAVIGPITMAGANLITDSIVSLFHTAPVLAGAIYGLISPPLVITGMHHLFLGVNLQMAGSLGYVTLWPIGETVTMAQGAAALTMFFLLKNNKKLRGVALTSTASAWMGITEPAIYGINLRFRYPFVAVMIGSAVGSAFLAYQNVKATSVGVGGVLSFLSVFPEHWASYFIGEGIAFAMTVGLTLIFYRFKIFHSKDN